MSAKHASWLEIDLARLDENLAAWRSVLGESGPPAGPEKSPGAEPAGYASPGICAVVKADAYGLGAVAIAHRLSGRGIDMLAVYSSEQARELLAGGLNCPILLLMPIRDIPRADPLYRLAVAGRLHLTVHDPAHAGHLAALGRRFGTRLAVHIYLDTGMSRGGVRPEQFKKTLFTILNESKLRLAGVATHFATAQSDPAFVAEQMERFEQTVAPHRDDLPDDCLTHAAGTFAALRSQRYHGDMVRLGLGLYGYGTDLLEGEAPGLDSLPQIRPILRWVSSLVHVERFPAGATVGYDRTHTLERDSILGLVPVGFADGYPLALSDRAQVEVRPGTEPASPQRPMPAPVIGRVSMDQIVVDLTDLSSNDDGSTVGPGTRVDLLSNDPASPCALPRLAQQAGSHCYELLCRLSNRLPRVHVRTQFSQPNPTRLRRFSATSPVRA